MPFSGEHFQHCYDSPLSPSLDGLLALQGGTHPAVVNMGYDPASSTESVSLHERQLFTLDCAIPCDPQNGGH